MSRLIYIEYIIGPLQLAAGQYIFKPSNEFVLAIFHLFFFLRRVALQDSFYLLPEPFEMRLQALSVDLVQSRVESA